MSKDDSKTLIQYVDRDDVDRDEVREVLYRYFNQNRNSIWEDALLEHELIKG